MPAKNKVKEYRTNGCYHIYNRGVEKRLIFTDHLDENIFLMYLQNYLLPKNVTELQRTLLNHDSTPKNKADALKMLRLNNFFDEIDLLAYCLMPNHFHLLVKQKNERSIEKFMKSLLTRYVQYFNKRHEKRVGGLFQDTYKGVLVQSEEQLLHLSRYIHKNPAKKGVSLKTMSGTSSYPNYLGMRRQSWVKPGEVLNYFSKSGFNSYENFVEQNIYEERSIMTIKDLSLDIP